MQSRVNQMYLDWLFALVESARPGQTFSYVFKELHRTKFVADIRVPLDVNRISAALELRREFLASYGMQQELSVYEARVSVLEVLMRLAHDMGDITSREDNIPSYFFELLENLGICIPDSNYHEQTKLDHAIYVVTQKLIKRRYSPSGLLFPLKEPRKDQRTVELWFQMQAYLIEQEDE